MTSIDRDQMVEVLTRARDITQNLQDNLDPNLGDDSHIDNAFLAGAIQTYDSVIDLISTPEERENA